jgi:hypothetical protein
MSKTSDFLDEKKFLIEQVKNLTKRLGFVQEHAESYINEYFQNVIVDIDLRREVLKAKIDKYSDKVIKSVKKTQLDCIKASKETNEITEKIAKSKAELDKFIKEIETFMDCKKTSTGNIFFEKSFRLFKSLFFFSFFSGLCINLTEEVDEKFLRLRRELNGDITKYKELLTKNMVFFNHEISVQKIFGEFLMAVQPKNVIR